VWNDQPVKNAHGLLKNRTWLKKAGSGFSFTKDPDNRVAVKYISDITMSNAGRMVKTSHVRQNGAGLPTHRRLDYVIRFQNTGTDIAYKVVVIKAAGANPFPGRRLRLLGPFCYPFTAPPAA
jgi:hypothetical protein